jgi:hypothetical protein
MNIFVFYPDLGESARYFFEHDPRRANKQILELTQCLATVLHERGVAVPKKDGTPYKPTHKNHPVVVWLRQSQDNLAWAVCYLRYLMLNYWMRGRKQHGCISALRVINDHIDFPNSDVTPVHHGKNVPRTGDVYKDYRDYLARKLENDKKK